MSAVEADDAAAAISRSAGPALCGNWLVTSVGVRVRINVLPSIKELLALNPFCVIIPLLFAVVLGLLVMLAALTSSTRWLVICAVFACSSLRIYERFHRARTEAVLLRWPSRCISCAYPIHDYCNDYICPECGTSIAQLDCTLIEPDRPVSDWITAIVLVAAMVLFLIPLILGIWARLH
jgi:hypothetical protein